MLIKSLLSGRPYPLLLFGCLLALNGSAALAQAATGRIDGSVALSRQIAAKRVRIRVYSEPGKGAIPPSLPAPDLKDEFANVVLFLELDGARVLANAPSRHPEHPSVTQREERFIPHTLPILRGTTVDFPNEDEVFHNVFSLSGPRRFDLPKYPTGESRSVSFPRVGVVNVFCHIHADMSAVILVLDNPYFVTPDTDGKFSLEGIPAGDYVLVAWHERIKPIRQKVKIVGGQSTAIAFNIPLPQPVDR